MIVLGADTPGIPGFTQSKLFPKDCTRDPKDITLASLNSLWNPPTQASQDLTIYGILTPALGGRGKQISWAPKYETLSQTNKQKSP